MRPRWRLVLLLLALCLLGLRFWHIQADFPDYRFYIQDRARFTDEGFYTGAALNYFLFGHAYIPGGWNPGVLMPVWPLMAGLLFEFTGISVAAVRWLAVACTIISTLLAYAITRQYRSRTFASLTAFFIAANALGFFFGRLALLEPAFVMFLLLAIYIAGRTQPGNYILAGVVGMIFTVATLTKTTAFFVLPAVLYPIWARSRANSPVARRMLVVPIAVICLLLGYAKLIWVLHYASDAGIIFALRPVWQLEHFPLRLARFFFRGTWIDPVLFPLALAVFFAAILRLRFFWRDTLFMMAFLWEAGYAAFIAFHYDGPPRYFVTLIVPTVWLALIFTEWLWRQHRRIGITVAGCIVASVAWNIASIGDYLMHPRYSLVDASVRIKQVIFAQHPAGAAPNQLLIGRGADEISLLSDGFPAMDSDGAMPLAQKLDVYRPGWFVQWSNAPLLRQNIVAKNRKMIIRGKFSIKDSANSSVTLYQLFPPGTGMHSPHVSGTASSVSHSLDRN